MAQLLERLSTGLNEIVKLVCVIIAVVLTVTIFIGVISRYILGKPFIWEYEFSIMLLVWMTFLGVSIGFKERAHLALTFLVDHSPPALRKAARVLAFLATILFAIFCIGFFIIYRTIHSPFGQILKAIRENEPRAISLGYDVSKFKLIAFVISAALAGTAGATKTLVFQLASLSDVHWHASGEVVLMTLLGGLGTILGPLVGAATIVALQTQLADSVGSWVTVIMGAIFVLCVLSFRRGIVGELQALIKRSGVN